MEPLAPREHRRVTVTVFDDIDLPKKHPLLVSPDQCADAAGEDVSPDEVRRLAGIQGSLSQAIVDGRRDRRLARLFPDTSVLAEYYRLEPGSDFAERLFADAGAQRVVSGLAMVEIESALATKVGIGEIDREAALIARRRLESDRGPRNIPMAAIADNHFEIARRLAIRHGFDRGRFSSRRTSASAKWLNRRAFESVNPEHPTLAI